MSTTSRPEPALLIGTLSAGLSLLTAFALPGFSAVQVAAIVAVFNAGLAVAVALRVRPVGPAVFTGAVAAVVALVAAYGYDVTPQVVGGLNALVVAVLSLLTRGQVTPVRDGAPV
jgi:hypothetical protein